MSFSKTYKISSERMEKAKSMIRGNGGFIDDQSFDVKGVKGRYRLNKDEIQITVTDTPWYASDSLVLTKLNEFFRGTP